MNGVINVTVHDIISTDKLVDTETKLKVQVKSSSVESRTDTSHKDEVLTLPCKDLSRTQKLTLQLINAADSKLLGQANENLETLLKGQIVSKEYIITGKKEKNVISLVLSMSWKQEDSKAKDNVVPKETTNLQQTKKDKENKEVVVSPDRSLSLSRNERPWFLRVSYYYKTGKSMYDYTTSFPVVSKVARLGENSANYILGKIGIESLKSTEKIDSQLVPALETLDERVDEKVAQALEKISKGQTYILETKDSAITKVSNAASSTVSKVSTLRDATVEKVSVVTSAGKKKVVDIASATVDTVTMAKDKTVKTVAATTSSTYETVTNTTVYLLSYVPIVGKKVMA